MQITEEKTLWYEVGEVYEEKFINDIAPRLNINAQINPEKELKPWVHDIIVDGRPSDLKRQTQPFFTSGKYGYETQYTITLNRKDIENYGSKHDPIDFRIYWWVSWEDGENFGQAVHRMHGIWYASLGEIIALGNDPNAKWHYYERRGNGDVNNNATHSLLIDLRQTCMLYYNGFGRPLDMRKTFPTEYNCN
tara:strand:+ start:2596 stop:3171 length:576 start_codon:yes stop_codon:yes gene_type:complete